MDPMSDLGDFDEFLREFFGDDLTDLMGSPNQPEDREETAREHARQWGAYDLAPPPPPREKRKGGNRQDDDYHRQKRRREE